MNKKHYIILSVTILESLLGSIFIYYCFTTQNDTIIKLVTEAGKSKKMALNITEFLASIIFIIPLFLNYLIYAILDEPKKTKKVK